LAFFLGPFYKPSGIAYSKPIDEISIFALLFFIELI
jgi:hypothetical protein